MSASIAFEVSDPYPSVFTLFDLSDRKRWTFCFETHRKRRRRRRKLKPYTVCGRRSNTISTMSLESILSTIDAELACLQQARAVLAGTNAKPTSAPSSRKKRKPVMSPEARKRIGDAQRKRWAAHKKGAK